MSPAVMTVNTVAGNPMLIPFGPSQSAGTVRLINAGGTVTFAEARQAAAYARIEVNNTTFTGWWNVRTTKHGGRPSPWVGHLLILLNQLGIHACNSTSFTEWKMEAMRLYIVGNCGWQQQFRSGTGNCRPPRMPESGQKWPGRSQYVLTWIAEKAGVHAVWHCPSKDK